jgi:bifunctional DNA-binding transcriptional regulator/antitoxin component of YhaV-PrlF toxin-antitoxin module
MRQTRGSKMSWKSSFKDLERAFNYSREHKTVSPEELAKKFGITEGESVIIIEWLWFGQARGSRIGEMPKDKASEVKGTPADVMEALRRGIISKEEAEKVLEQMRKRDKKNLA